MTNKRFHNKKKKANICSLKAIIYTYWFHMGMKFVLKYHFKEKFKLNDCSVNKIKM